MSIRFLTALPVYNEVDYVEEVLAEVANYAPHILVVDDGSNDGTAEKLAEIPGIAIKTHGENRGYGAALKTAFQYAIDHNYEFVITLDCDGQHQPKRLPRFVSACQNADIVSGSRYLKQYEGDSTPPFRIRDPLYHGRHRCLYGRRWPQDDPGPQRLCAHAQRHLARTCG